MPLPSSITGAVAGVVLLAGVFGFTVGLPEVTGDGPAESEQAETDRRPVAELLPETILDGGLRRLAEVDPQIAEVADQVETYGSEKLTEVFGDDVAVGRYATQDRQTQVAITIYDGESGLFIQAGPPVPPELSASSGRLSDTARIGDAVCVGEWETAAFQQGAPPFQTQCQRVSDGRTYNAYAGGSFTLEQTAQILDDVIKQAEQ